MPMSSSVPRGGWWFLLRFAGRSDFSPGETLVARVEDDHLVIEKPESVERRIRARFRKSRERSLAEELIAERP